MAGGATLGNLSNMQASMHAVELGGVIAIEHSAIRQFHVTGDFHESLHHHRINHNDAVECGLLAPWHSLPQREERIRRHFGVGEVGQITYVIRHIQRSVIHENAFGVEIHICTSFLDIRVIGKEFTNLNLAFVESQRTDGPDKAAGHTHLRRCHCHDRISLGLLVPQIARQILHNGFRLLEQPIGCPHISLGHVDQITDHADRWFRNVVDACELAHQITVGLDEIHELRGDGFDIDLTVTEQLVRHNVGRDIYVFGHHILAYIRNNLGQILRCTDVAAHARP